jgi:hypothetical protein
MDPARLSKRTLEQLRKMSPEKRDRAKAIINRTQTPEARAKDAADRALLDREYKETGRIATVGAKTEPPKTRRPRGENRRSKKTG